ncbi:MAG: SpoIID/LytB domain-containing protein [Actinomycetota bacterium]
MGTQAFRRGRLIRLRACLLLGALLVALAPVPVEAARKELGAAVAPLRLIPTGSSPISVRGLHGYFGSIELGAASDGIVVSNRLPLERYLLGLAEVPLSWPEEALKAQAVAARTYALYTLAQPSGGSAAVYGFDICASVQCQVFSGADVVAPLLGARWRAAVEQTAGQAVTYQGSPILARYHSTSGGQTLDNPQAFPTEPAYPYLRSVPSPTEQASPLFRWTVDFPLKRLQRILSAGGMWEPQLGRLVEVGSRPSSSGFHYPDLVLRGRKGSHVVTAEEFRTMVREVAPRLYPGNYPSLGPTSSGRLPETLPSNRIDAFTRAGTVRVIGRGWGHGVGMSQWGAYGLASRGASYLEILTHYYTGVEVGSVDDPGPIEVGVAWARPSVTVDGEFEIVDGRGRTLVKDGIGSWTFHWAGAGVVEIDPPQGYGLPLTVGIVKAPKRVQVGESVYLTVALSRPARVRTVTKAATAYQDPGVRIAAAGRRRIVWPAPLEEGRFSVRVEARAGSTRSRTRPVEIEVFSKPLAAEPESPEDRPRSEGEGSMPWVPLAAGAAAILLGLAVAAGVRRRMQE